MKNKDSKKEQPCTIQNVRQDAFKWWSSMSLENQFFSTIEWLSNQNRDTTERHPRHLTGREIQEIYELLHSA